jgi:hypothetical protein
VPNVETAAFGSWIIGSESLSEMPSYCQQTPPSSLARLRTNFGVWVMTKCAVVTAAVAIVGSLPGAMAQALSPTPVYEANTTIPAKNGATEAVHISVQSWAIVGQEQEIPVQGFYVAHLLSGQILATIDGQTTQHLPGDYWTVKAGAAMGVKTVGEVAVLETTVVSKQ